MAATKVGATATNGAAPGTSVVVTLDHTATAGELILVAWSYSKGSNGSPTISCTGYTSMGKAQIDSSLLNGGCGVFAKFAAGGETSVTVGSTSSVTITVKVEQWTGLDSAYLPVEPTAPDTWVSSTSGVSLSANNIVTDLADEFIFCIFGGRGPSGGNVSSIVFGGGATAEDTSSSGRAAYINIATDLEATASTSVTHNVTFVNTQGSPVNVIGSIAFKVASTAINASPTGIASAEAFGTSVANVVQSANPSAIVSAEAFGTAVANAIKTASPTGIPSAEAFGATSATFLLTCSVTGISSAESFGTPIANVILNAIANGIASQEAFGTPTAGTLLVAIATGIPSSEAFGVPSVAGNIVAICVGIGSQEAFGLIVASQGGISVMANSLADKTLAWLTGLGWSPGSLSDQQLKFLRNRAAETGKSTNDIQVQLGEKVREVLIQEEYTP